MKLYENYKREVDLIGLAGTRFDLLLIQQEDSDNIYYFPDLDIKEKYLAEEFVEYLERVYDMKFELYWNDADWAIRKV